MGSFRLRGLIAAGYQHSRNEMHPLHPRAAETAVHTALKSDERASALRKLTLVVVRVGVVVLVVVVDLIGGHGRATGGEWALVRLIGAIGNRALAHGVVLAILHSTCTQHQQSLQLLHQLLPFQQHLTAPGTLVPSVEMMGAVLSAGNSTRGSCVRGESPAEATDEKL